MSARRMAEIIIAALVLTAAAQTGREIEERANPRPPVVSELPNMPHSHESSQQLTNLTVMLVPHSHDDTGWQRTVDQYYEEEVRYIYDTVVAELQKDSRRRFIFVETAYFMRWWREQDQRTRDATKRLFATGQIEFVNGGWCMADDASPALDAQIDQLTLGHRYIRDTLGEAAVPKIAWHIDPFGESSSYALWFKAMNFSTWVFNRIDTRLKDLWHNDTRLQFQWQPDGAGTNDGIFSHVLDTHYGAPEIQYKGISYHFDYEVFGGLGGGESAGSQIPVSSKSPSAFYNETADAIAEAFVAMARLRAAWFRFGLKYQPGLPDGTGAILVPFGDDMKFQNAHKQYSNMDRLIDHVNSRFATYGVHVRYATLSEYFNLLKDDSSGRGSTNDDGSVWPSYGGDFFPLGTNNNIYSDQPDLNKPGPTEYWTGHYSTRPLMKSLAATAGAVKHVSEIALSMACARNTSLSLSSGGSNDAVELCTDNPPTDLMLARDVTSVLQHHDSITGTSKQEVTADLDVRLRTSLQASTRLMAAATAGAEGAKRALPAGASATAGMRLHLFNGLGQMRTEHVALPLADPATAPVVLLNGKELESVVIPAVPTSFKGSSSSLRAQLVFRVELPPLSTTEIILNASTSDSRRILAAWDCVTSDVDIAISGNGNGTVTATFSAETKRLSSLSVGGGKSWSVVQSFAQYHSLQASNAYQFAPNRTVFPFGEPLTGAPSLCVLRTPILERVVQTYSNETNGALLRETVTVYAKADVAALEVSTDFSMATKDRELITRYVTDLETGSSAHAGLPAFETDSNGHLMVKRVTNVTQWGRNVSVYNVSMAVAGNYYPLSGMGGALRVAENSADGRSLALVTDTAHGAASLRSGWLEMMLGRRCAEGEGIAVDDTDNVTLTTFLVPGVTRLGAAAGHRLLAMRMATPVVPILLPAGFGGDAVHTLSSPIVRLPPNVHLLSLDRVAVETTIPSAKAGRVILRLRHVSQVGEAGDFSSPAKVDLTSLLPAPLKLVDIVELPLNGIGVGVAITATEAATLQLQPLQIRTFEATIASVSATM